MDISNPGFWALMTDAGFDELSAFIVLIIITMIFMGKDD